MHDIGSGSVIRYSESTIPSCASGPIGTKCELAGPGPRREPGFRVAARLGQRCQSFTCADPIASNCDGAHRHTALGPARASPPTASPAPPASFVPPVPLPLGPGLVGVPAEVGLLPEGRWALEPPPGPAVGSGGDSGEDPSLVGLQVVVVTAEQGQVIRKSVIRPLWRVTPTGTLGIPATVMDQAPQTGCWRVSGPQVLRRAGGGT